MLRTALALLPALGMLAGCVSIRPVAPGSIPELGSGEGLLVVHVRTAIPIEKLVLSEATVGANLAKGEHFYLIATRAGDYRWSEVRVPAGSGAVPFRTANADVWRVRVAPGRVNYAGMLVFGGKTHERGVEISVHHLNRSAETLGRLRAEYPGLLERYPPVYGGEGRDEFLDYFSRNFLAHRGDAGDGGAR